MALEHVLESCLCVDDIAAAIPFYRDILGLPLHEAHPPRHAFFRCGQRMVLLFHAPDSLRPGNIPPHGCTGSGHLAFAAREVEIDAWRQRLTAAGVTIEKTIDWPQGGVSLYFRDPSGNSLEIATPRIWGLGEETL
jgi:catechol 2,3-dioxygenase-like lactoylglutathione lyase family enzyme